MAPANFHKAFVRVLLHTWWGLASAVSTVVSLVALFLPPGHLRLPDGVKRLIPWALSAIFLITLYRSAWLLYDQSESDKGKLRDEIAELNRRPYDDAHRKLVEGKVAKLDARDRDLLRFLLHRGRVDDTMMRMACTMGVHLARVAANTLHFAGLIAASQEESSVSNPRGRVYWMVNPQFAEVLRDLLYPRNESDSETYFRT